MGFLIVYAVDKIFYITWVQENTVHWQKIEPLFYESRGDLYERLRTQYPERSAAGQKLGLILGTSRAGEFDQNYIASRVPDSYTFNFSAPFSCPAFH